MYHILLHFKYWKIPKILQIQLKVIPENERQIKQALRNQMKEALEKYV